MTRQQTPRYNESAVDTFEITMNFYSTDVVQGNYHMYDSTSPALLARAGRLPMTLLPNVVELPNGELYKIKEPNTKVVIRYKVRSNVEELEKWKRKEQELLERIKDGETSLEAQLAVVRFNIEIQSKAFTKRDSSFTWGSEDHPDFKVIELDLGIVDKAPAEDD